MSGAASRKSHFFDLLASHVAQPDRLADACGFPVPENSNDAPVEQVMVETIKGIFAVSSWSEFFDKVRFSHGRVWGKEKLSQVLSYCVEIAKLCHVWC
jgi:hypothetical protein